MNQLREDHPERWAADALDEVRCLACHTNPSLATKREHPLSHTRLRTEGVSCEACHGNASEWLLEHTNWKASDRSERYQTLGMMKLYDLGDRAAVCAGCHVGAPADAERGYPLRDVNHEMLAAGHPRLNFEFADYQRRLPPHWQEKDRSRDPCVPREPEFEAKAWLVGRVASAEAACRLLADRALRAERDETAEWPELSESNCFQCHRELLPRNWRATGGSSRATAWQTIWPLTRVKDFSPFVVRHGASATEAATHLANLKTVLSRREPRPTETALNATRAAAALRALRAEVVNLPDRDATKTVLNLYAHLQVRALDWDEACQVTQGLVSLEWVRLRRMPPGQRISNPLFAEVYSELTMARPDGKEHFDSPRRFDPVGMKLNLNRLLVTVRTGCAAGLE